MFLSQVLNLNYFLYVQKYFKLNKNTEIPTKMRKLDFFRFLIRLAVNLFKSR